MPPPDAGGGVAALPGRVAPIALRRARPRLGDTIFGTGVLLTGGLVLVVLGAMIVFLVLQSLPAMQHYGFFSFISSARWAPSEADPVSTSPNPYGILQFIYGTVLTSVIGMIIALPLAVGAALVITDIAPQRLRRSLSSVVDLLAAVPSVIFGLIGILVLVPLLTVVIPPIKDAFGDHAPFFFSGPFYGPSILAAGVVLSVMIAPYIISVSREVLLAVPKDLREAAFALGATRWETTWQVVVPSARRGIMGSIFLALARALGETMAVTMVVGNTPKIAASILAPGDSMASVVASQFTEAVGDLYLSSLIELGLVLFAITIVLNGAARLLILATAAKGAN